MLVVTPFHPGDADQALRLFRWISELEGRQMSHDLMLITDTRCSADTTNEIRQAAEESFRTVTVLPFVDHFKSWPAAPNAVFSQAARHIMSNQRVPWLFLEPDCCPLKAGWLDAIEAEYKAAGKPFMGARVEVNDVPLHLSGNAVYPVDMFQHAGNALIAGDLAWDVVAASQIVPQAHFTKLIEHSWKRDPVTQQPSQVSFESWEQVEREVSKEAVIYHASKNGSLIDRLRERKNNVSGGISTTVTADGKDERSLERLKPTLTNSESRLPAQFICDILIKSYPPDFERLSYCLRSIDRFASGFRRVILVVPESDQELNPVSFGDLDVIEFQETGEPYLFQQTVKANAHALTDADYVLHLDSDCILTRPITPETFFRDGKPLWLITPYATIQAGIEARKAADPNFHCGALTWKLITEKFLGEPVEFEFMRRLPLMCPRALHVAAAEFCKIKHGMSLTDYILSQPAKEFSEFNSLGALAYSRAREDFYWLDTTKESLPESVCIQEWSHAPFTAERKTEFELILSGTNGEQQPNGPNVDPLPAQPILEVGSDECILTSADLEKAADAMIPWRNSEQSVSEIRYLAERLRTFCAGGAKTRRVREELHRLGVIELTYRMKRRKGWRKRKAKA